MLNFRPSISARFLLRPRLLQLLPGEPGHVVLLQAPYGYGKSILASQWAASLEDRGTRIIWTVAHGLEPIQAIAVATGLPGGTPWEVLSAELWKVPTLLVFEDLETLPDHGTLAPLLDDPKGFLLLASRIPVATPGLELLASQGRVTEINASALAFTLDEALKLFQDGQRAEKIHQDSYGWPLPLHFASLTGELPDEGSILQGMIDSLSPEEWQEALLLAALPYLPNESATAASQQLGASGFAQEMEAGYRLNSLIAEQIRNRYPTGVFDAVRNSTARLPYWLLASGFERTGNFKGLEEVLERVLDQPWRHSPEQLLHWDSLLGQPAHARRDISVGSALKSLGRHTEATARFDRALATADLSPEERIFALGQAGWSLVFTDPAAAQRTILAGEDLLDQVPADRAARFLSNASVVDSYSGRFDDALGKLHRARDYLPPDSDFRVGVEINIAINVWDRSGDLDLRLQVQRDLLDDARRLYHDNSYGQARDVAMLHWWLGDLENAKLYLRQAQLGGYSTPAVALEAEAALAFLANDPAPMRTLLRTAKAWEMPYVHDIVTLYAIRLARPEEARHLYEQVASPGFAAVGMAERLAAEQETAAALEVLDSAMSVHTDREYALYLKSCRYRVTRDESDLEAFLDLTTARERTLPGFIPIDELPPDRPGLSRHYQLTTVLKSGWNEAIAIRHGEIPPLEIRLLGGVQVFRLGEELRLLNRSRELLLLLCLGLERERLAQALWPELDKAAQTNNLHVQMSALRQILEPGSTGRVMMSDGSLHAETDIARLRRALDSADAKEVLNIYRAPLAPEISLTEVSLARDSLHSQVVELFLAQTADPAYATRIVEMDPLNEEAVRMTIRLLLARGHRWAAQQRFESFRTALAESVGLDPEPETVYLLNTR